MNNPDDLPTEPVLDLGSLNLAFLQVPALYMKPLVWPFVARRPESQHSLPEEHWAYGQAWNDLRKSRAAPAPGSLHLNPALRAQQWPFPWQPFPPNHTHL